MDPSTTGSGKDDTAVEVFRDFTTRAYHLEWDSEEEDYHESSNQSTSRDRSWAAVTMCNMTFTTIVKPHVFQSFAPSALYLKTFTAT